MEKKNQETKSKEPCEGQEIDLQSTGKQNLKIHSHVPKINKKSPRTQGRGIAEETLQPNVIVLHT